MGPNCGHITVNEWGYTGNGKARELIAARDTKEWGVSNQREENKERMYIEMSDSNAAGISVDTRRSGSPPLVHVIGSSGGTNFQIGASVDTFYASLRGLSLPSMLGGNSLAEKTPGSRTEIPHIPLFSPRKVHPFLQYRFGKIYISRRDNQLFILLNMLDSSPRRFGSHVLIQAEKTERTGEGYIHDQNLTGT